MANYSALPAIHEMAKRAPKIRMDPRSQSAIATLWNGCNLKSSQARRSLPSEVVVQGAPSHRPRHCAVAVRKDQVRIAIGNNL